MMADRHTNRGGHNRIELSGCRFGKLMVLVDTGRRKSRRPIWACECDCGGKVDILGKYLLSGDTKSCGCITIGNAHNRDAVGQITKSFWTPILKQASRRGIPFEITRNQAWSLYLDQESRCALTGEHIWFSTNIRDQRGTQTASLDRKDREFGYVLSNVQWVHKSVNIMKNVMTDAEFVIWCRKVHTWMHEHPDHARASIGHGRPEVHAPAVVA